METDDEIKRRKLELEKKAIMGYESEMNFYKERIRDILEDKRLTEGSYPQWYPDLTEAVFAELYGLSGLAPWAYDMTDEYAESSSAKLIGDRLYCLIDGKSVLQPQRIPAGRREQLKRALLLATPRERLEYGFHEVYLRNGIRITIYSGHRTKENQDVMVFRKYLLKSYDFEGLADLGTIPQEAVSLFKLMVSIGFNVIFAGQVRSGKTTFMQVWQSYENRELEGLAIATDPETPWHTIMGDAPIMQIVASGKELDQLNRSILRGDNDYVLLEEMRDAQGYNLALDITSSGTVRSKGTIHDNDGVSIPYKMASKICEAYGGNLHDIISQIYKNFDYVIEMTQMDEDRSRKVMKGIIEYSYDVNKDQVRAVYICKYDFIEKKWIWNNHLDKSKYLKFSKSAAILDKMKRMMEKLADGKIYPEYTVIPAYYRSVNHEL